MQAVRVEVGVDWFSMSLPVDKNPAAEWYQECLNVIERIESDGNEAKERHLLGYSGISVGNCFAGVGESTYYCQLSGSYAQRFWRDVYRVEGHTSRLDIQCTAFFDGTPDNFGVNTFTIAHNAAIGKGTKPKWSVTRLEDNNGGYSIYIGSKSSEQYANIYNKEAESGKDEYKGAWRYEVRFKNEYATKMAYELFVRPDNEQRAIQACVQEWLSRKGVDCPWETLSTESLLCSIGRGKTDKETALWWLANQVKPALDKAHKLGYYVEACQALGLVERPFYSVSIETGEVQNVANC